MFVIGPDYLVVGVVAQGKAKQSDDFLPNPNAKKMVSCPICGMRMPKRELYAHKKQYHTAKKNKKPIQLPQEPHKNYVKVFPIQQEKPGRRNEGQDHRKYTRCPICDVRLLEKNLKKHLRKKHSKSKSSSGELKQSGRSFNKCPICNAQVLEKNLNKHMRKVHPNEVENVASSDELKLILGRSGKTKRKSVKTVELPRDEQDRPDHEGRFAGKYLGYMSREHGRFGSIPLYDDYSEESGPD
jgi:hypothetical protein